MTALGWALWGTAVLLTLGVAGATALGKRGFWQRAGGDALDCGVLGACIALLVVAWLLGAAGLIVLALA